MTKLHVFADMDKIPVYDAVNNPASGQGPGEAYGPVVGDETTQFRVTSRFILDETATAYAATTGVVFVQPVAGSTDLVNLVLQPLYSLDEGFMPVKYFIYRGLRRANFVDANDDVIQASSPDATDLITDIWATFNQLKIDDPDNTDTAPSNKSIGFHHNGDPDSQELDAVFFEPNPDHQLHLVHKGMSIGVFEAGNHAGFEIMLKDHKHTPDLGMARASEHIVQVAAAGSMPGNEPIATMRKREEILNFIDPAAYFMMFYESGVEYKTSTGTATVITGFSNIYNNIVNKFYTKNVFYLDIRNENGYSINYYKDNQGQSGGLDYGRHFEMELDGSGMQEQVYYQNYWPLFTLPSTFPPDTVNDKRLLGLAFRVEYNPEPLVYLDYGFLPDDFPGQTTGAAQFVDILPPPPLATWSDTVEIAIPNIPSLAGNTIPAYLMRLYIVRKTQPAGGLPVTGVPRTHYLDNVFGPILAAPAYQTPQPAQWRVDLGKKYLNASKELGFEAMVQTGMAFSATEIIFFAEILNLRSDASLGDDQLNQKTLGTQTTANDSVANGLKERRFTSQEEELQKVEVEPGVYVATLNNRNHKRNLFMLSITKTEYEDRLLPAAGSLNPELHEVYLNLFDFAIHENSDGLHYAEYHIKVSGLDAGGDYQEILPLMGQFKIYTFDRMFFNTDAAGSNLDAEEDKTNPNAYIEVDDLIDLVKDVETVYVDNYENVHLTTPDTPLNTSVRMRVHYYGTTKSETIEGLEKGRAYLEGKVLEMAIINSEYEEIVEMDLASGSYIGQQKRRLYSWDLTSNNGITYKKLTAKADENVIQDNPGPYINVPKPGQTVPPEMQIKELVDLGHVLYGFDSLATPGVSKGYECYNTFISNDFAGFIPDLVTPIADVLYHEEKGESAYKGELYAPSTADLNQYFEISAPEPDLLGDADGIGLYRAYEMLNGNADLRFSDVLTLYYKGAGELRPGLTISGPHTYYTVAYRWFIVAEFFSFVTPVPPTTDTYNWLPDLPDTDPVWSGVKDDLKIRMYNFTKFWYNTLDNFSLTGITLFSGYCHVIDIPSTQESNIDDNIEIILHQKFASYIKTKILEESSEIILT